MEQRQIAWEAPSRAFGKSCCPGMPVTISQPKLHELAHLCVVGAGTSGLTAGCLAPHGGSIRHRPGRSPAGAGDSSRSSAHLSDAFDCGSQAIERIHGPGGAGPAAPGHSAAIDRIESIILSEGVAPCPDSSPGRGQDRAQSPCLDHGAADGFT